MNLIVLVLPSVCAVLSAQASRPRLASAVAPSTPTAQVETLPNPRRSATELHDQFIESIDENQRSAALEALASNPPATTRDVQSLFDLFMRFPQAKVRDAVLASIRLLDPASSGLESAFIEYLKLPENEAKFFGIDGALRLRSLRALPLITEIAQRRFSVKSPGEAPILSDKNEWWTQYEALSALAQWQGPQALPLLRRKTDEAPAVARLMALYLWKESLPDIVKWAGAGAADSEKAQTALAVDIPLPALRATRAEMLRLVLDRRSDRELRHQLAIKVGFASTPEEVDALLTQMQSARDTETKLMLSAALFASRSPRTIPWLKQLLTDAPDPKTRIGALTQLRLLIPAAKHRPLAESFAAHDPDQENRELAAEMLKLSSNNSQ